MGYKTISIRVPYNIQWEPTNTLVHNRKTQINRFHRSETVQQRIYAASEDGRNDVKEAKFYLNDSGETDGTKFVNEHNVEFCTDSIVCWTGYELKEPIKYKNGI